MCGMWTEAQIVKFWKASETSPHDWFFILKNIQLIQVNHLIYKRRRCFGSSLYCKRWKMVGKGWKRFYKKKRNPINMKIFFNSPEIVFLRSIAQNIQENSFHQIYFFPNFHNQIFICQMSRRWVGLYAARRDLQTPHSRLGTAKHHDKGNKDSRRSGTSTRE